VGKSPGGVGKEVRVTRSWIGLLAVASFLCGGGNIPVAGRSQSSGVAAPGGGPMATSGASAGVAERRAAHLRHGINLSEWFQAGGDPNGLTKQHFDSAITEADLALIQAMGFDHVRLCINPAPMFRRGQADQIPADYLGYLDAAVKMILAHGLAVEMDIHASGDFKHSLATDDGYVENFADFWRGLAQHFSGYDPERVFFEILNEPETRDPYRWYGIETKLAGAIRTGAPQHTIIATGARWSDDDDLLFLEPLRDANVIYTFHFYESHIFTHQGATWGESWWHFLRGVPYPSDPENVMSAANEIADPVHRLQVVRYGTDRWNATRIDKEIAQTADWSAHWRSDHLQ